MPYSEKAVRLSSRFLRGQAIALLFVVWCEGLAANGITLLPVPPNDSYPEATAPQALHYACASRKADLAVFFEERRIKLEPVLIRARQGHAACHVFYEPTVPGFRASPDDQPVTGLFAVPDPLAFVLGPRPTGESIDVIKSVLSRVETPLDVTLTLAADYDAAYWERARELHFSGTRHRIQLRPAGADLGHPWAQDHVKAGVVAGRSKVLVPWRLFEGRGDNGSGLRNLLDAYQGDSFVRSKLSWEGGDLLFVSDPRNAGRLILVFGEASLRYWGGSLDRDEFSYVLRAEFGADHTVDLSDVGPHADFLVAFVPQKGLALVSRPERENTAIARGAAIEWKRAFGPDPPPEAAELVDLLAKPNSTRESVDAIRQKLIALRRRMTQFVPAVDPRLMEAFEQYTASRCPGRPTDCLSQAGKAEMLSTEPGLMRRMTEAGNEGRLNAMALSALLGLIEGQLRDAPQWRRGLLDEKAREIEQLGFRVERVPYLVAPNNVGDWAGISYVNLLSLEGRVFVPTFGLREGENRILSDLQEKLGTDYEVVAVPARASLLLNGGIHCTFGTVRAIGEAPDFRLTQRRHKGISVPPPPVTLTPKLLKKQG